MSLDFSNAQLPRLLPLEASFSENDVEADLKHMFLDIFGSTLAADVFDVNVLGAAHLGSFDLVRKAVNTDGLVLLQGDREEAATRYLYRAWKWLGKLLQLVNMLLSLKWVIKFVGLLMAVAMQNIVLCLKAKL